MRLEGQRRREDGKIGIQSEQEPQSPAEQVEEPPIEEAICWKGSRSGQVGSGK